MVTGISMHKGYAFVQYGTHEEAKRAAMSEDGKTYAGQTLGKYFDIHFLCCSFHTIMVTVKLVQSKILGNEMQ